MWRDRKVVYYKYNTDNHKKHDKIKCHLIYWSSIRCSSVQCSGINIASFAWDRSCQARRQHYAERSQKIQSQLKYVLCLIIDKRSMLSSKVLGAAERNIQKTVYNGQNSQEIWGGVPAVLLFGNDYQLWPVIEDGAIQGFSKMTTTTPLTPTNKQTAALLLCQCGTYLFTHVMMESVFFLDKNYRVKSEEFRKLLARLRVGESTTKDAQ
jgi:hypothetical protein